MVPEGTKPDSRLPTTPLLIRPQRRVAEMAGAAFGVLLSALCVPVSSIMLAYCAGMPWPRWLAPLEGDDPRGPLYSALFVLFALMSVSFLTCAARMLWFAALYPVELTDTHLCLRRLGRPILQVPYADVTFIRGIFLASPGHPFTRLEAADGHGGYRRIWIWPTSAQPSAPLLPELTARCGLATDRNPGILYRRWARRQPDPETTR